MAAFTVAFKVRWIDRRGEIFYRLRDIHRIMDILSFQLRDRLSEQPPGARVNSAMDGYRRPQQYYDFLVNGKSLADMFDVDQRDLVGMLTPENLLTEPPVGREIFNHFNRGPMRIHELTLKIPCLYEFRRVHIYGCPECGDLYCGSVTMQLIETAHSVIWQRFDNGREELAGYMSPDKSYSSGNIYDLWLERNRDYAVLDAFGSSPLENDYEFLGELKYGQVILDAEAEIRRGNAVVIDHPEIGPFEFDKVAYLKAFEDLKRDAISMSADG